MSLLDLVAPELSWERDALCREYVDRADAWFPTAGEDGNAAKAVCRRCLVRSECLDYALSQPGLGGIWGGTNERDRKRLRTAESLPPLLIRNHDH